MLLIELREAAYDKAFNLLDEVKENNKENKMIICALEDVLYDCYESSKDDEWDHEDYSESPNEENYGDDMKFRRYRRMRSNYRHMTDDDMHHRLHYPMYRKMHSRRNRMGMYA